MGVMPRQIGRYQVERLIGSGSMGHVYLGHDSELDRPVALKILRDLVLTAEMREVFLNRFQNEARAAARLHHPNIVQIFDVGDDADFGPYLVFEYVEGRTLKDELKKAGPLAPARLLQLAQQVGDALATAHLAGVIHRDLKPENLLITQTGQVKLADFGIARVPNADLTKEGQFLGTPCYAAPETLRDGEYSERSDLFSFGALLYEAASGERAFPGTEAVAVAHQVMNDDPPPPSEVNRGATIPTAVDAAILRALRKNPAERYASARAFVSALRVAYEGEQRQKRPRRRARLSLIPVIGLGVGAALWLLVGSRSPDRAAPPSGELGGGVGVGSHTGTTAVTDLGDGATSGGSDTSVDDLSPHEREEAAKDELARARAAIERGNLSEADQALEKAAALDPNNPDIAALQKQVRVTQPDAL